MFRLTKIVKDNLQKALQEQDVANITRYCKLHVPLNMRDEGLSKYVEILRNKFEQKAEQIHKRLRRYLHQKTNEAEDPEHITCAGALILLYKAFAVMIHEQTKFIEETFGQGSMQTVITSLSLTVAKNALIILDQLVEQYEIVSLVS